MGSFCLLAVISLLTGTVRGQEPNSPYFGCQWDNMQSLNCTSIGISTLGDVLPLNQNQRHVPSWPISLRVLRTMKHIDLSFNKMTSLQLNVLYKFSSLETLNVSNNQIVQVSLNMNGQQDEKHTVLSSLQTLVIDRNRLTGVPKGMGILKSLQTLCLSGNKILEIQWDDFTNCTHLQQIDLGSNRIYTIHPDAFRDLRNLQILKLSSNELVSISPLVFLYSHVLSAHIDLSDNLWACDCRILPLKRLISSMVGATEVWNITCSTPPSRAGYYLLSTEHFLESYHTTDYARTLVIAAGERTSLHCDISDKHGITKVFWWTPHGIMLDEPQVSSHYTDRINDLILARPDHSDEGLYICVADMKRIAYQVHVQTNEGKPFIRNPRDVRLLNSRIRTEEDFALAVSLSVILSFLCAFCLGVFLRPYIETLWRKQCKSKDLKENSSSEVYENEGFTEENAGIALDKRHDLQSKAVNQQCVIEIQAPTHTEMQERHYINEDIDEDHPDSYATVYYSVPETKGVTRASNANASHKVNLKYVMSLIKPINIIAPDITISEIVKSPTQKQFFPSLYEHQENSIENIDNSSHDHYEDIKRSKGPEEKDTGSSDNESNDFVSEEGHSSYKDAIMKSEFPRTKLVKWASVENISPIVNLKYLMALIKPINIIAPDSPMTDVLNSPEQNHLFLSRKSKYPHNRIENIHNWPRNHDQDTRLTEEQQGKQLHSPNFENNYSDTLRRPKTDREVAKIPAEHAKVNSVLLRTKIMTGTGDKNISPTVNLKHVMALLKPINIIAPDSTVTDVPKSPKPNQFLLSSTASYPENRMENVNRWPQNYDQNTRLTEGQTEKQYTNASNTYSDTLSRPKPSREADQLFHDKSSSSEDSNDVDEDSDLFTYSFSDEEWNDALDEDAEVNSDLLRTKLLTGASDENISPTVNLKHVMALIKPINIIAPDSRMTEVPKSTSQFSLGSTSRYPDSRVENIDTWSRHHDKDNRLTEDQPENQLNSTNVGNNYPDTLVRPKLNKEGDQIFYDNSSSSEESNDLDEDAEVNSNLLNYSFSDEEWNDALDEDAKVNSDLLRTKVVTVTGDKNINPTVNLKHVMALIKPINIIAPDFRMTNVPKSPSQFSLDSTSRYPDSRVENLDNWTGEHDQYTILNGGQLGNHLHNTNVGNNYPDTLIRPKPNKEGDQIFYDNSSSSEESNDLDEDAEVTSDLLKTKLVAGTCDKNISPKVNLKHLMALIKPINIIAPDSRMTEVPKNPNQFFQSSISRYPDNRMQTIDTWSHYRDKDTRLSEDQSENQLKNTNLEKYYSETLRRPKPNREADQIFYGNSSSDEESNDALDEDAKVNSDLLTTKLVTGTGNKNISPTVNLKQVMALLKPINIIATDSIVTEMPKSPNPNQFLLSSTASYPDNRMENVNDWPQNYDQDRLTEGQTEKQYTNFRNNYSDTLSRPKSTREADQLFYYNSSSSEESIDLDEDAEVNSDLLTYSFSDEESSDALDEDAKVVSDLLTTKLKTGTVDENISPTVNLKHVMALIKPINIITQDSKMTDVSKSPSQFSLGSTSKYPESRVENIDTWSHHNDKDTRLTEDQPENQINNTNFQKKYSNTLSRPEPKREANLIFYDSSSSDEESNDALDEDAKVNSDLHTTKLVTWTGKERISPAVNLKHVMALIKPINIIAPDSTMTDVPQSPKLNHFYLSSKSKYPHNRMENIHNWTHNHDQDTSLTQGQPENPSQSRSFEDKYSDPFSRPRPNKKDNHIFYDNSSSDDWSNVLLGAIANSDLPNTKTLVRASDENGSTKVNLRHAISLIKPINIVSDVTITDIEKSPTQKKVFPNSISGGKMENVDHERATELSGDRLEKQLLNSNYYLGIIDKKDVDTSYDSSSDKESFISFSKFNSLSHDIEEIYIVSDKEMVMDAQSSSDKKMYGGDISYRHGTPGLTSSTTNYDDISVTGQPGPIVSVSSGSQGDLPKKAILLDLYKQEWITKPIVDTETLTMSFFNESKTYLLPDLGETSTDGNFMDFNVHSNGSFKPLQKEAYATADVMSDNTGSYFAKRRKVFDAFSASLKSEQN